MSDLTPDLVRRAGLVIYGEHWKRPLSEILHTTPRTLSRIEAAFHRGEAYDINPAWAPLLRHALEGLWERRAAQERAAREVLEALAGVQPRAADDPRERMRRSRFRDREG